MQENHPDCSGMAQHGLVLGPGGHVQPDPSESAKFAQSAKTPVNPIPHRNLTNLNLYAFLLEPQQSRNRASLRQWEHEWRLLREDQPDQSMRQSGVSVIRWTSGHSPSRQ